MHLSWNVLHLCLLILWPFSSLAISHGVRCLLLWRFVCKLVLQLNDFLLMFERPCSLTEWQEDRIIQMDWQCIEMYWDELQWKLGNLISQIFKIFQMQGCYQNSVSILIFMNWIPIPQCNMCVTCNGNRDFKNLKKLAIRPLVYSSMFSNEI